MEQFILEGQRLTLEGCCCQSSQCSNSASWGGSFTTAAILLAHWPRSSPSSRCSWCRSLIRGLALAAVRVLYGYCWHKRRLLDLVQVELAAPASCRLLAPTTSACLEMNRSLGVSACNKDKANLKHQVSLNLGGVLSEEHKSLIIWSHFLFFSHSRHCGDRSLQIGPAGLYYFFIIIPISALLSQAFKPST